MITREFETLERHSRIDKTDKLTLKLSTEIESASKVNILSKVRKDEITRFKKLRVLLKNVLGKREDYIILGRSY